MPTLAGQLNNPEVLAGAVVDIQPEAGVLQIETLGSVDIRYRDNHELELEIRCGGLPAM
jgi:hypothetical protein